MRPSDAFKSSVDGQRWEKYAPRLDQHRVHFKKDRQKYRQFICYRRLKLARRFAYSLCISISYEVSPRDQNNASRLPSPSAVILSY